MEQCLPLNWDVLAKHRDDEYPELRSATNSGGIVYLDHMGSGLAPMSVRVSHRTPELLANPHSTHALGLRASALSALARAKTLELLCATEEYDVVFTASCTSALETVARCFPFEPASHIAMHRLSHNSLLGVRELLPSPGNYHVFECVRELAVSLSSIPDRSVPHLVCFPAECNFSGYRLPTRELVQASQATCPSAYILVDGAAMVGKAPVVLDGSGIDFFTFSFYKVFGAPTGVGGLLVRRGRAQATLLANKRYFGGGTVASNVVNRVGGHVSRPTFHEAMEHGTPNFQAMPLLLSGFDALQTVGGVACIQERIRSLRVDLVASLKRLRHPNGSPLILVHEQGTSGEGGSSVAFSVLEHDKSYIGHTLVERLLAGKGVYLRSGCFCNPGACEYYIGHGEREVIRGAAIGHVCWDDMDIIDGKPTGCLRASLGATTLPCDTTALIHALDACFLHPSARTTRVDVSRTTPVRIKSITVYPVKGLKGVAVEHWPITTRGLLCDRMWMIVDVLKQAAVSPKQHLNVSKLTVSLDWGLNVMNIQFPASRLPRLRLVLDTSRPAPCDAHLPIPSGSTMCRPVLIRGEKTLATYQQYLPAVNEWLSDAIGLPCALVRHDATEHNTLSNTDSLLIVHEASHHHVLNHIRPEERGGISLASYRPNIVVTGGAADCGQSECDHVSPFAEHLWQQLTLLNDHGEVVATLSASGPCHRCQQVNVRDGALAHQPLAAISWLCRQRKLSEVIFGQLFQVQSVEPCLVDNAPRTVIAHGMVRGVDVCAATMVGAMAAAMCWPSSARYVRRVMPGLIAAGAMGFVMRSVCGLVSGAVTSTSHAAKPVSTGSISIGCVCIPRGRKEAAMVAAQQMD